MDCSYMCPCNLKKNKNLNYKLLAPAFGVNRRGLALCDSAHAMKLVYGLGANHSFFVPGPIFLFHVSFIFILIKI